MFPRKILLRSPIWQEKSYLEAQYGKKNLAKKPNMARKKLLRTARYREKVETENQ